MQIYLPFELERDLAELESTSVGVIGGIFGASLLAFIAFFTEMGIHSA